VNRKDSVLVSPTGASYYNNTGWKKVSLDKCKFLWLVAMACGKFPWMGESFSGWLKVSLAGSCG